MKTENMKKKNFSPSTSASVLGRKRETSDDRKKSNFICLLLFFSLLVVAVIIFMLHVNKDERKGILIGHLFRKAFIGAKGSELKEAGQESFD